METKNVTIRVPENLYDALTKDGKSISQQLVETTTRAIALNMLSRNELKGKFTPGEWKALADTLNGLLVEGQFRYVPSVLVANLEDGDLYEGLSEKWGIDLNALCEKVESLTAAQLDALYSRVESFWEHSATTDIDSWAEF